MITIAAWCPPIFKNTISHQCNKFCNTLKLTFHDSRITFGIWFVKPPKWMDYFCRFSVSYFTMDRNDTHSDLENVIAIVLYWLFTRWKEFIESVLNCLRFMLVHCPADNTCNALIGALPVRKGFSFMLVFVQL